MDKGIYPTFFLLAARRRKKSTTANYLISTDATDLKREGTAFVGKVDTPRNDVHLITIWWRRTREIEPLKRMFDRSSLLSYMYVNVDDEVLIKIWINRRTTVIPKKYPSDTNVLGFKGPRKMHILIPGIYDVNTYERKSIRPSGGNDAKDTLLERYRQRRTDDIIVMQNKSPVWNEDSQSYVLNFHGRVTQASVKNFQIIHDHDPDYIVMQFGRISDECFSMDFRYPLSALQAFGIAMTSFHGKLACE
ncbi:Tub family protein [Cooperia oncophora]